MKENVNCGGGMEISCRIEKLNDVRWKMAGIVSKYFHLMGHCSRLNLYSD